MHVIDKDVELALPDGWRAVANDDGAREWLRNDGTQLILKTYDVDPNTNIGETLDRMVAIRRDAASKVDATSVLGLIARETLADRIVATYDGTAARGAIAQFTAVVASTHPLVGRHALITFAYTSGPSQAGAGRALFDTLRFQPHSGALREAAARTGGTDLARLYPYIAPASYLEPPATPMTALRKLGHGLVQLFAEDHDGVCSVLGRDDIGVPDLTLDAAIERSLHNLEALLRTREIAIAQHEVHGIPLLRFGDHWLAAACIVVPGVCDLVRKTLGAPEVYAMIPHRDTLLCFPAAEPAVIAGLVATIRANEAGARKPLSMELFRMTPGTPEPC